MSHVMEGDDVHDHYVPYPVQSSIPYFRDDVKEKCLLDMESLPEKKHGENFAIFAETMFGETLMDSFIRPYNEKVALNRPLKEMFRSGQYLWRAWELRGLRTAFLKLI